MKISEARDVYSAQVNRLNNMRQDLIKKKKEAEGSGNKELAASVSAKLDKVEKQCGEASKFMEGFNMRTEMMYRNEAAKKQREKDRKDAEDARKCLEIVRRLSRGDKVPYKDEQKLMNYNREVYMMSKSMAAMNQGKKHKEHKSLWKDEQNGTRHEPTAEQIVENSECTMEMPAELFNVDAEVEE